MSVDKLLQEFYQLSSSDQQFFLGKAIAHSLGHTKQTNLLSSVLLNLGNEENTELTSAQIAEIDRRWLEIEQGMAKLIPHEEAIAKIDKKYGFDTPPLT